MISVLGSPVLLATVLVTLFSIAPLQAKDIRDWFVWCDEVLECSMQTNNSEDGIYAFGFQRGPKANAEPILFASLKDDLSSDSSISLVIDGGAGGVFQLLARDGVETEGVWRFPGQNENHQILRAMMSGKAMDLSIRTNTQSGGETIRKVPISLSGVTGSALHIDDKQGRLGRQDAIQAVGDKEPADAFTRATRLASSADLPDAVMTVWQSNGGECSEDYDGGDLVSRFGGFQIAGEPENFLYLLPCGSPGAYNLPHTIIAYHAADKEARRLHFPTLSAEGPTIMDTAINLSYDPADNTLIGYYKGRGIGDCGISSTWKWDGYLFAQLILVREARKDDCDGDFTDWPQVWPVPRG